ncbi:glycine cleavage T C-terminal barrel domain-containing protein [Minwuia sp.]|uniref:glycine cleavage T C-terminal barrel domain-containing protein n=1 Tax=Minwuia sp. TaxID=2493630 RepID=UPI003A946654
MTFDISYNARIRKSPFFDCTVADGVKAFTTYNQMLMPAHYGDPEGEYWRLIDGVSMWDVSVERQAQISGPDAARMTQLLVPRDVSKIRIGQGRYAPISDAQGRLLNDPVLLKLDHDRYWLSLADSNIWLWARGVAYGLGLDVEITEPDVSPLAIQGPKSFDVTASIFGDWVRSLAYFAFHETVIAGIPVVVARSGWSHQGGFEIYLKDGTRGKDLWNLVKEAGQPFDIGPGTPTTVERVESGLLSYGTDTRPDTNGLELGLGKFINLDMEPDFVGKSALRRIRDEGIARRRTGLFIDGERLPTAEEHWPVLADGEQVGVCTIAVFSLRLQRNIAIAIIENTVPDSASYSVETPDGTREATETPLPFCTPGRV